jgi:hypothetical protein
MGFGYLALWLANGRFDRDYGSGGAGGYGGSGGSTRGPDAIGEDATDESSDDDPERFRNIAAVDAEREEEEDARESDGRTGTTDRDR